MDYIEILTHVSTFIVSGGLATIITLKATRRKASGEADAVEATNMQTILEVNQRYIVDPLTREIGSLRRTVNKLTDAVSQVSSCKYALDCPVRHKLQEQVVGDEYRGDREGVCRHDNSSTT